MLYLRFLCAKWYHRNATKLHILHFACSTENYIMIVIKFGVIYSLLFHEDLILICAQNL